MLHQCLVAPTLTIKLTVDEEMAHCFLKYTCKHGKAGIELLSLLVEGICERTFAPQFLLHVFGYVEHHVGTIR